MKAVILYRPNSEHARRVEEFVHEFQRRSSSGIQLINIDTLEGARMAELYGIMDYPAVLVIKDDQQLLKHWEGALLPLVNELTGYLVQT
jgi:hypothetical protein